VRLSRGAQGALSTAGGSREAAKRILEDALTRELARHGWLADGSRARLLDIVAATIEAPRDHGADAGFVRMRKASCG
jgi:hypothetical protein